MMIFGNTAKFAWVVEPTAIAEEPHPSGGSWSAEVRTLGSLKIVACGRILTRGHYTDDQERFDLLDDVPLIDLATWLAEAWRELVFSLKTPASLTQSFSLPLAERWEISSRLHRAKNVGVDAWAQRHAMEFAATDYTLPNVVLQRVDDFVEVSWSSRSTATPGNTVVFDSLSGSTLVDAQEFADAARQLLAWVSARCDVSTDDPRLVRIREVLDAQPVKVGWSIVRDWFPDWGTSPRSFRGLDDAALAQLGSTGVGRSAAIGFLRSATGTLTADEARDAIGLLDHVAPTPNCLVQLRSLANGLDDTIDPAQPWTSGYELARRVRAHYERSKGLPPDTSLDIEAWLRTLGVSMIERRFQSSVDGACFLTEDGRVLAVLNPDGRLARTRSGRRSTLAHEFCHLLFDSKRSTFLGQIDLRMSGTSVIEKRANAFAAELLLPRSALLGKVQRGSIADDDLRALCRQFEVSADIVRRQAQNLGITVR